MKNMRMKRMRGIEVEFSEVKDWLDAKGGSLTDQNDTWETLGIYATPGVSNLSRRAFSIDKGSLGHSWIKLTSSEGEITTFGTFERGLVREGQSFQVNYERDWEYEDEKHSYDFAPITKRERLMFDMLSLEKKNQTWGYFNNCTDYAVRVWESITSEDIYPSSFTRTPKELYNILLPRSLKIYLPKK